MKIPVLGMDPSLTHWGLAFAMLDLETGFLDTPHLTLVCPIDEKKKQVRVNSNDLFRAKQLSDTVFSLAKTAKIVFVEIPVGSQSARAMASYGICLGILGALQSQGTELIEVTATEVKLALTNNKTATKSQMIEAAVKLYPDANFPMSRGKIVNKAEHVADAIGSIHAGVKTPLFKNTLRLLKGI